MLANGPEAKAILPTGWTSETLHFHLTQRIDELDKRLSGAIHAVEQAADRANREAEKATLKSESSYDAKFASTNEFRSTLTDQAQRFIARTEVDSRLNSMNEKLGDLTYRISNREAKGSGLQMGWTLLVGMMSAVALLIGIIAAIKKW